MVTTLKGRGGIGLRDYGIMVKFVRNIGICLEKLRDYRINVSYGIGISIKKVRDYRIRVPYSTLTSDGGPSNSCGFDTGIFFSKVEKKHY